MRIRNDYKTELFRYCLYGIEEIKLENKFQFTFDEEITCRYLNTIIIEVDSAIFKIKNRSSLKEQRREFKNHWKSLLQNIKDPSNKELRAKIVTGMIKGENVALMKDVDFYSQEKL